MLRASTLGRPNREAKERRLIEWLTFIVGPSVSQFVVVTAKISAAQYDIVITNVLIHWLRNVISSKLIIDTGDVQELAWEELWFLFQNVLTIFLMLCSSLINVAYLRFGIPLAVLRYVSKCPKLNKKVIKLAILCLWPLSRCFFGRKSARFSSIHGYSLHFGLLVSANDFHKVYKKFRFISFCRSSPYRVFFQIFQKLKHSQFSFCSFDDHGVSIRRRLAHFSIAREST